MSVQRYQASRINGMLESPNGTWVLYDDVKQGREADARIMEEYGRTIIKLQDKIVALNEKIDRRNTLIKFQEAEILGLTIRQQHVQQVVNEQKLIDIRCVLLHSGSTSDERMKIDRILQK